MPARQFKKEVRRISTMDRIGLVRTLRGLHCNFELDFTDEFLESISLQRLRHIVTAAMLHAHEAPPASKSTRTA